MFERFTERARQVVVLAQDEARALKHNYIGTEHLLLGLMREEEGLAARVLESLGLSVEEVRAQVARIVGRGDELSTGQIPFTPRAKEILELSLREALSMQHNYIGTEHILLGLVRENQGVASRIMDEYGATAEVVRDAIIRMLSGPGRQTGPPASYATSEHGLSGWAGQDVPGVGFSPGEPIGPLTEGFVELREADKRPRRDWLMLAAGAGIFVAGLVAGWLIWG